MPVGGCGKAAWAVALALLVLGAGCDESRGPEVTPTAQPDAPASPSLPRIKWLDAHDSATPEQWLASREAEADLAESDPAVVAMRADLNKAAQRFGEPPRMIANRAVQLEEMLAAEGINERAPELIDLLYSAAMESRLKEGFGSLCQHYFNLRKQGVERDVALEQLKETSLLIGLKRGTA